MKRAKLTMAALAATLFLSGCGTTATSLLTGGNGTNTTTTTTSQDANKQDNSSALSSLLGNVLGAVLGNSNSLSQKDLIGTWSYQGADCVFESENLLLQAGGEVAATKVETQLNSTLAKIGVATGTCSFTFNSDNTYTATIGGRNITGQYTLDAENKKITMTYLAGVATMTPNIVKNGAKISLLYEAEKLLAFAQKLATLSGNSNLQALASLASSYDGMMIGIELQK